MDDENVPRRLRRFLRKGESIPENLLPKEQPRNEPWNQPAVTVRAKSNIAVSSRQASEEAIAPRHRGKRFQEMQEKGFTSSPASPMDKAIGLEKKNQFQERMPSSGNKAIEMKKDEIQKALEEIKRFSHPAAPQSADTLDQMADHIAEQNRNAEKKEEEKNSSFHFTAIGAAPNPVDARKLGNTPPQNSSGATPTPLPASIPISDLSKLSARERMELRRQRRGQSIPPTPGGGVGVASGQDIIPSPNIQNQPPRSHVRRRMGQVDENASHESGAESEAPEENMTPEAEEDFKDLFAEDKSLPPKKKKSGKPVDENEELDSEEDMELFEEEK
jgi:hypothetical protein